MIFKQIDLRGEQLLKKTSPENIKLQYANENIAANFYGFFVVFLPNQFLWINLYRKLN